MSAPPAPTPGDLDHRTAALVRLEQEVGVLVRRVRRVIAERAAAVHPDLQPAAYLMLSHLDKAGPMRASVAADELHLDKGAVSRQVTQLLALGLVERTPDPEDGRAQLLTSSPEGTRRLAEIVEHRRTWLSERLHDWDDADLDDLVSSLTRYNATLDQPR